MRSIRTALCLLVLAIAATACSPSESTITNAEAAPFDAVLFELFGTTDTDAYLMAAERRAAELVATCMNEAGFEFQIPPLRTQLDPPDPRSLEDARTMGFGIITEYRHELSQYSLEEDFGQDPNLAYLATLSSSEIDRFLVSLNGVQAEAGQRSTDTGCNGDASDIAYGDWVRFSEELPNYTAIGEERDTHPDWLAARADWRDCMIDQGFDYAEPEVIRTDVVSRMRDTVNELYPQGQPPLIQNGDGFMLDPDLDALLDELAEFEQSAAVANVECTAPVADQFDAVERLVQQEFVDRNREAVDVLLSAT